MNKSELVNQISSNAGLTKSQANEALRAFTSAVGTSLRKGEKVTLVGFGTFTVANRAARNGVNPKTKQEIKIPSKNVVKFKAGKELAEKL